MPFRRRDRRRRRRVRAWARSRRARRRPIRRRSTGPGRSWPRTRDARSRSTRSSSAGSTRRDVPRIRTPPPAITPATTTRTTAMPRPGGRRARSACSGDARSARTAVGGVRDVPVPDAIARDYLLLALRLDQHVPGTVDGYFGPADRSRRRSTWSSSGPRRGWPRTPVALRARLAAEVPEDAARRHWLDLQLVALETLARTQRGEAIPYLDQVTRCFAFTPVATPGRAVRGRRRARSTRCCPGRDRSPSGSPPRTRAGRCRPTA